MVCFLYVRLAPTTRVSVYEMSDADKPDRNPNEITQYEVTPKLTTANVCASFGYAASIKNDIHIRVVVNTTL